MKSHAKDAKDAKEKKPLRTLRPLREANTQAKCLCYYEL